EGQVLECVQAGELGGQAVEHHVRIRGDVRLSERQRGQLRQLAEDPAQIREGLLEARAEVGRALPVVQIQVAQQQGQRAQLRQRAQVLRQARQVVRVEVQLAQAGQPGEAARQRGEVEQLEPGAAQARQLGDG